MLTNREKLLKVPPDVAQEYCKRCGKPLLFVEIKMGSIKQRIFRPCFCTEDTQASTRGYIDTFGLIGIPSAYIHRRIDYSAYLQAFKAHKSLLLHSIDDTSEALAAKLAMYTSFNTISSRYVQAHKLLASNELYEQAHDVDMLSICGVGSEPKNADTLSKLYSLLTARISAKQLTVLTSRFDKEHLIKHYECAGVNAFTTLINDEFTYYDVKDTDEKVK